MLINKNKEISPIFITGAWRSGTTLISRMLNNHPDLEITYDTAHFMRFSYNKYNPINDKKNVKKLIIDSTQRLYERYNLKISPNEVLKTINSKYNYSNIYNCLMKVFLLQKNKKKIWGEKTNLAWTKVPDFFKMYPKGRVLHIVRDPRAVLLSWKKFTSAPGNDYLDSILNCYDSMKRGIYYKKIFNKKRYKLIRYEDLVTEPHKTVKSICKKFEIKFEKTMLDSNLFTDMHGNKWLANTSHKKFDGISKVAINKWKSELNSWEIYITDLVHNKLLPSYKYKPIKSSISSEQSELAIKNIEKSKLANNGILRYFITKEGFERYPSDPLKKENW